MSRWNHKHTDYYGIGSGCERWQQQRGISIGDDVMIYSTMILHLPMQSHNPPPQPHLRYYVANWNDFPASQNAGSPASQQLSETNPLDVEGRELSVGGEEKTLIAVKLRNKCWITLGLLQIVRRGPEPQHRNTMSLSHHSILSHFNRYSAGTAITTATLASISVSLINGGGRFQVVSCVSNTQASLRLVNVIQNWGTVLSRPPQR